MGGRAHASDKGREAAAHSKAERRRCEKAAAGPCPIMHRCGGCEWLGIPYSKQLARKQAAIEELFRPLIERFGWTTAVEAVRGMGARAGDGGKAPSPRAFRYKAATPFSPGPDGAVRSGFYERGTHRIIAAPACPVEADGARAILAAVARAAEALHIPAYHEDTRRGLLRHAVVRMGWKTDEALLTIVTSQREIPHAEEFIRRLADIDPRIRGIAHNINPRPGNAILGNRTRMLWGAPSMRDELLGCTFEISPTAFYQTNPLQTEELYRIAIEDMQLADGDVLLDAYCGSGTIGICAARAARNSGISCRLIGVERNAAGVSDARRNAALNGLDEMAEFIEQDATAYMHETAARDGRADVLVLDPPRAGSTPEFLRAATAMRPRTIVYISCNPMTQVRDLELLGELGWNLERLTPVDMFPHTAHTETVARLQRA